jgi:transposase
MTENNIVAFRPWLCENARVGYDSCISFMGDPMGRFIEGADRSQLTVLPECLEDRVGEDNTVHVIDTLSKPSICIEWVLTAWSRRKPAGRHIMPPRC